MSFIQYLLEDRARKIEHLGEEEIGEIWGSGKSAGDTPVNEVTSLSISAVQGAVQFLSSTLATFPLKPYKRIADGREQARDHASYNLLSKRVSSEMTSFSWRQATHINRLLDGNSYSEMEFDSRTGELKALHFIPYWLCSPKRVYKREGGGITEYRPEATIEDRRRGGTILYQVNNTQEEEQFLHPDEILHFKDITFDGLVGISRLRIGLESILSAMNAREWINTTFSSESNPGGIIKRPIEAPALSKKGLRNRVAAWEAHHKGVTRTARIAILQEGEEYMQSRISPIDAQIIEQLKLSPLDVANIFNVPPHVLAHLEGAIKSNIEEMGTELVAYSLMPHLVSTEQELNWKLFLDRESDHYVEHTVDSLLRGRTKDRMEAHKIAIESGITTPANVARIENYAPVPPEQGGDIYRVPMNYMAGARLLENQPRDSKRTATETRERSLEHRDSAMQVFKERVRKSFHGLFLSAFERVVTKEIGALESKLKTLNPEELAVWARGFYPKVLQPFLEQVMQAPVASFAAVVAEREIEALGAGAISDIFSVGYVAGWSARYASARANLVSSFARDERATDLLAELVRTSREKVAQQQTAWELVRTDNAVSMEVFKSAGFKKKIWVKSSRACPLCQAMDGKVAELDSPFLSPGEKLTVENEDTNDLEAKRIILAAPLHRGCTCTIRPAN